MPLQRTRAFSIIELIIVVVVIGILASLAMGTIGLTIDRTRAAEALDKFAFMLKGYENLATLGEINVSNSSQFDPQITDTGISLASWQSLMFSNNPNAEARLYFSYYFLNAARASTTAPVNDARNVFIATWRNRRVSYSTDLDTTRWLYIDADTGEIFKSAFFS